MRIKIKDHNKIMTNEAIKTDIKKWIELDRDVRELQRKVKEKRTAKKALTERIVGTMRDNNIDIFNTKDGKIVHTQTRQKAPITKKHLLACLDVLFEEDSNERSKISDYILNTRSIKVLDSLKKKN